MIIGSPDLKANHNISQNFEFLADHEKYHKLTTDWKLSPISSPFSLKIVIDRRVKGQEGSSLPKCFRFHVVFPEMKLVCEQFSNNPLS